jgi:ankyrin repeat protein
MSASASELIALPIELILDIADHLPAKDLVHLARSNHWLFRLLSPRVDNVALEYRVPPPSQGLWYLHRSSVLHWAVENNHPELVKRLVVLGAPIHGSRAVDHPDDAYASGAVQSALDLAIEKGQHQIAELLLAHGAEVNAPDPYSFRTPMSTAAMSDKIELAELLLTHGADPCQSDACEEGMTPLHCAAEFRSSALVERLLSLGVDPNIRDNFGHTPLHSVARDLVEEHWGQSDNAAVAIAKKLLEAGANTDLRTNAEHGNRTALHLAAFHGNPAVLGVLLESGADVAVADVYGGTPLHSAAIGEYDDTIPRRLKVVKLLLEYGADVKTMDRNGDTPLDHAIDNEPLNDRDSISTRLRPVSQELQFLLRP